MSFYKVDDSSFVASVDGCQIAGTRGKIISYLAQVHGLDPWTASTDLDCLLMNSSEGTICGGSVKIKEL